MTCVCVEAATHGQDAVRVAEAGLRAADDTSRRNARSKAGLMVPRIENIVDFASVKCVLVFVLKDAGARELDDPQARPGVHGPQAQGVLIEVCERLDR